MYLSELNVTFIQGGSHAAQQQRSSSHGFDAALAGGNRPPRTLNILIPTGHNAAGNLE